MIFKKILLSCKKKKIMKYLLLFFLSLPLSLSAQVFFNCSVDENSEKNIVIFHDDDYSHFCINDKIYHLIGFCKDALTLRARIRSADETLNIYIDPETIEIRDENYNLIRFLKVNKSI